MGFGSKKKIVVFSGAGVSAESGISTFRDSGGLWEQYNIEEVATPEAFENNPSLVLDFYNQRRKQIWDVYPNDAHKHIAALQQKYQVHVITQNIDDLHERAGSTDVLHLHGEIKKCRSTLDPELIYEVEGWELKLGDLCEKGSQLRPHIVWFGEEVPNMDLAAKIAKKADIFIIVGTSLNVYPAAGLVNFVPAGVPKYIIDPHPMEKDYIPNLHFIQEPATKGMIQLYNDLV